MYYIIPIFKGDDMAKLDEILKRLDEKAEKAKKQIDTQPNYSFKKVHCIKCNRLYVPYYKSLNLCKRCNKNILQEVENECV
jgi:hypothetical protein